MKQFIVMALLAMGVFACQQNPQNKAAAEAEKQRNASEKLSQEADDLLDKSTEKATESVISMTRAEFDEAISKVEVPTFEGNSRANNLTKKIGNLAVDFIGSPSKEAAQKYMDQIEGTLDQVDKLADSGKLDADVAASIKDYATKLSNAVQVDVYGVEVEVVQ